MKAKSLLTQAAKCQTEADAQALLDSMQKAFCASKALRHLGVYNPEAYMENYMEDSKPFVRFELNHKISDSYITMIRPEIRNGALRVDVVTSHMHDGHGPHSQAWSEVEGLEDHIPRKEDDIENGLTVTQLANLARDAAIANHAELIERVGVPRKLALTTAAKLWNM